ncbi:type VII secretion system-associated protein [Streptomyces liangshanensis]|uniref:type VII secretion system-associated protein n=1 Tax=Streptomyces liangshanensis TaxID=2717324 RepID=UPI0036D7D79F
MTATGTPRTTAEAPTTPPDGVTAEPVDPPWAPPATATATATGQDDAGAPVPAPPREITEAARLAPDHWLSVPDPDWSGRGRPPEWAVPGRWRSGDTGEIVEWQPNPGFRPSPTSLGWPVPGDPAEAAIQLAVTGYGPSSEVMRTLARAVVDVPLGPGGEPLVAAASDGSPVVPVFTMPGYLGLFGDFATVRIPVADLLERIPAGHALYVNPSGPAGLVVDAGAVGRAVTAPHGAPDAPGSPEPRT